MKKILSYVLIFIYTVIVVSGSAFLYVDSQEKNEIKSSTTEKNDSNQNIPTKVNECAVRFVSHPDNCGSAFDNYIIVEKNKTITLSDYKEALPYGYYSSIKNMSHYFQGWFINDPANESEINVKITKNTVIYVYYDDAPKYVHATVQESVTNSSVTLDILKGNSLANTYGGQSGFYNEMSKLWPSYQLIGLRDYRGGVFDIDKKIYGDISLVLVVNYI